MLVLAVNAFLAVAAIVAVFQLALLMGAPWGEWTLGGRWRGALPLRVRVLPAVSLLLLVAFSVIVLARADIAFPEIQAHARTLIWVVVGYSSLGVVANAVTPSRKERFLWLPVVICMLALSGFIACS